MLTIRRGFISLVVALVAIALVVSFFELMFQHLQENFEDTSPTVELVTPQKLLNLDVDVDVDNKSNEELVKATVDTFLLWADKHKDILDKNDTGYTDIDIESILKYKSTIQAQRKLLKQFDSNKCEEFKRQQNDYKSSIPILNPKMTATQFNKKLNICYQVYAPSSQALLRDEDAFYTNIIDILKKHAIVSSNFDLQLERIDKLNINKRNSLIHHIIQFSDTCKQNLHEIEMIMDNDDQMRQERIYNYENESIFIRPNSY